MVGATAAALSTAAASAGGLDVVAADVTAIPERVHHPSAMQGSGPYWPGGVAAEEPMTGRAALSAIQAQRRLADIRATREAKRRQLVLIEAARPKWKLPLPAGSYRISSSYGPRWGTSHEGLDMAAPAGTPIYAAGDGTVLVAGWYSGHGHAVLIELPTGTVTLYGHSSKVLVTVGEKVKAGQLIALVGSTGYSTGNHLHFEVRLGGEDGSPTDPLGWLADRGVVV